jgi:hypothetical protein
LEKNLIMESVSMTHSGAKDKEGCFSRPDDSEENFLSTAASWTPKGASAKYPETVRKAFFERFSVHLGAVPLEVSSKGLMPWELACCWTDDEGRGMIQMRPLARLQKRVPLNAVVVHEAVHAVRGRLKAKKFEECTAYAACRAVFPESFPRWRAWIGPLFSSAREAGILIALLWISWGVPIFLCSSVSAWAVAGIDGVLLAAFLGRLQSRWNVWNKAMSAVVSCWPKTAWKLMIRMTDDEIEWLSKVRNVREEISEKAGREWRWRYFLDELLIPLPEDQERLSAVSNVSDGASSEEP